MEIGIVGLPNVGKSTLFNALTNAQAKASNYAFCTIDPNVGIVEIPDSRLDKIAKISNSEKIVKSTIKFVDIAGLVEGASKGEGLGNKFLSHIREVDAIVHVVRCFDDEVDHVYESIDPIRDISVINLELILADIDLLNKVRKKSDKIKIIDEAISLLENEKSISHLKEDLKEYNLLSVKPMLIATNVREEDLLSGNEYTKVVEEKYSSYKIVRISSKIEYELSQIEDKEDRLELLKDLGLEESCLDRLIVESYKLLGLINFFTSGPKESRSWIIEDGSLAPKAASKIHSDIERGFIRAETSSYDDFINCEGKTKEKGLLRSEGKNYVVKDGDVILFRFNV